MQYDITGVLKMQSIFICRRQMIDRALKYMVVSLNDPVNDLCA